MEKLIVDRIENGIAVLEKEDLSYAEIAVSELPVEIKEGCVILFDGCKYSISPSEEDERRRRIMEKQRKIFKNK